MRRPVNTLLRPRYGCSVWWTTSGPPKDSSVTHVPGDDPHRRAGNWLVLLFGVALAIGLILRLLQMI